MTGVLPINLAWYGYIFATIFYTAFLSFNKKKVLATIAYWILIAAVIAHTAFQIGRFHDYFLQHGTVIIVPTSLFESVSFFAWIIAIVYAVFEPISKFRGMGALVVAIPTIMMGYVTLMLPAEAYNLRPLMPALKSPWLNIHVMAMFISYGAFAVAFAFGLAYIFKANNLLPVKSFGLDDLDRISYNLVSFGFPFITFGIIAGAIWANAAWGRYWGWDPKETSSLVTWLIYAAFLHTRVTMGWKGTRSAALNVIGFAAILFTFIGVNFLPGLHSYMKS
jgi:cytochrome c-type biogenesis protein CcsB